MQSPDSTKTVYYNDRCILTARLIKKDLGGSHSNKLIIKYQRYFLSLILGALV